MHWDDRIDIGNRPIRLDACGAVQSRIHNQRWYSTGTLVYAITVGLDFGGNRARDCGHCFRADRSATT
jgi:hypothetical protein